MSDPLAPYQEVETVTMVPVGSIVPSRRADFEDWTVVGIVAIAWLIAMWAFREGLRARRARHRIRRQMRAIGAAAVGMALRLQKGNGRNG